MIHNIVNLEATEHAIDMATKQSDISFSFIKHHEIIRIFNNSLSLVLNKILICLNLFD